MAAIAAFPDFGGSEDVVNRKRLQDFRDLAGRILDYYMFSINFFNGIKFPELPGERLPGGSIMDLFTMRTRPIVRLMPRSNWETDAPDPKYSLRNIVSGSFDEEFVQMGRFAKKLRVPAMFDFACEVNGDWFPWCHEDPELYVLAFQKIASIIRGIAPASTFAFHINSDDDFANVKKHFPGDDYADYVGASIYGSHKNGEDFEDFEYMYDNTFDILKRLSNKPICIFELGACERAPGQKGQWLLKALDYIKKKNEVDIVSLWHEDFKNDDGSFTQFRFDSSPEALAAYRQFIADPYFKSP